MGLMQKACETYDTFAHLAGVEQVGQKETLAPISHTITSAQLEVTLNSDGSFVSARKVDKSEDKIVIPVTEESLGRTSGLAAHPLCDQLGYVSPYDDKKFVLYLNLLSKWESSAHSHPLLKPILHYVRNGTILDDLQAAGLIEVNEQGKPADEKLLVRWSIAGLDVGKEGRVWRNQDLYKSYTDFYASMKADGEAVLDMVFGGSDISATQHPKGVVAKNGNAKLISANDTSGFTYRGRFTDEAQACTVSYKSSQKAHNALHWLTANQGVTIGVRTFLCWNPNGIAMPKLFNPFFPEAESAPATPTEYRDALRKTLLSYKAALPENEDVLIASFDAATSGRLAATYYSELKASDFLERLYHWDTSCCWANGKFGIQSPSLPRIVDCAFGTARTDQDRTMLVTDDKIKGQHLQRLLECRVNGAAMPRDIEAALVKKASNLMILKGAIRETMVFTACAVIKKYREDHLKEEWSMALEPDKMDVSYQYGRLLALMEKTEQDYYARTNEERETNAIRMMSVFCNRPLYATQIVNKQLRTAYLPRMDQWQRDRYARLSNEIINKINEICEAGGLNPDAPLKDTYLLGYHSQRNEFFQSNKNNETKTEEE